MSSKGQIVLPAELREQDRIQPGEEFTVERLGRGDYRLVWRTPPQNEGVVEWLLSCPEKGYFVPIESESTGDSLIATTALVHGLVVATRNRAEFEKARVEVIDPFMV